VKSHGARVLTLEQLDGLMVRNLFMRWFRFTSWQRVGAYTHYSKPAVGCETARGHACDKF